MLHGLITIWFGWLRDWGYFGVFVLMALESTIVPVPSELVMPPAAYWAAQGHMNLWGVILAGTLGSYVGSVISYWVFYYLGTPLLKRAEQWPFIKPDQIQRTAEMIEKYGVVGIFIARLLPVVRHLISMPAGLFKMSFTKFSLVTLAGSGFWCTILSVWGQKVIGKYPELLNSPNEMMAVVRKELASFVFAVLLIAILYTFVKMRILNKKDAHKAL